MLSLAQIRAELKEISELRNESSAFSQLSALLQIAEHSRQTSCDNKCMEYICEILRNAEEIDNKGGCKLVKIIFQKDRLRTRLLFSRDEPLHNDVLRAAVNAFKSGNAMLLDEFFKDSATSQMILRSAADQRYIFWEAYLDNALLIDPESPEGIKTGQAFKVLRDRGFVDKIISGIGCDIRDFIEKSQKAANSPVTGPLEGASVLSYRISDRVASI